MILVGELVIGDLVVGIVKLSHDEATQQGKETKPCRRHCT